MLGFRIMPSSRTRWATSSSEDGVQGLFCHLGATLHGVVTVHQHFGLDDGHQAGFLAERGIESQDQGVGLEASLAGDAVADGDHGSPLGKAGTQFHVLGEALAQPVQTLRDLFVRMCRHRLGSGIDLDPRDNADFFERLGERNSGSGLLADGFVHQDGAVQTIAEARSGDDHVAIGTPGLFVLGNARWRQSAYWPLACFRPWQAAPCRRQPWLLLFRSADEHPSSGILSDFEF